MFALTYHVARQNNRLLPAGTHEFSFQSMSSLAMLGFQAFTQVIFFDQQHFVNVDKLCCL